MKKLCVRFFMFNIFFAVAACSAYALTEIPEDQIIDEPIGNDTEDRKAYAREFKKKEEARKITPGATTDMGAEIATSVWGESGSLCTMMDHDEALDSVGK